MLAKCAESRRKGGWDEEGVGRRGGRIDIKIVTEFHCAATYPNTLDSPLNLSLCLSLPPSAANLSSFWFYVVPPPVEIRRLGRWKTFLTEERKERKTAP